MTELDVLVLGGGPAGALAATELVRLGHRVALIDPLGIGGRLLNVGQLMDRRGAPMGTLGWDRAGELAEHALLGGLELIFGRAETLLGEPGDNSWTVTADGVDRNAAAVLVATGCRPGPVPGDEGGDLHGRGVSYCAVCDAGLFAGRTVAVIGGGDIAMAEAASLAPVASHVIVLVAEPEPSAAPGRLAALASVGNVVVRTGVQVRAVRRASTGGTHPSMLVEHTGRDASVEELEVSGVFGAAAELPNSELLRGIVPLDDGQFVRTDQALRCDGAPGLFAAGDLRAGGPGDLEAAEADGRLAAVSIDAYLRSLGERRAHRPDRPR